MDWNKALELFNQAKSWTFKTHTRTGVIFFIAGWVARGIL